MYCSFGPSRSMKGATTSAVLSVLPSSISSILQSSKVCAMTLSSAAARYFAALYAGMMTSTFGISTNPRESSSALLTANNLLRLDPLRRIPCIHNQPLLVNNRFVVLFGVGRHDHHAIVLLKLDWRRPV